MSAGNIPEGFGSKWKHFAHRESDAVKSLRSLTHSAPEEGSPFDTATGAALRPCLYPPSWKLPSLSVGVSPWRTKSSALRHSARQCADPQRARLLCAAVGESTRRLRMASYLAGSRLLIKLRLRGSRGQRAMHATSIGHLAAKQSQAKQSPLPQRSRARFKI